MNLNKFKAMLGFAVKAGKIVYGLDNISTFKKKIYLIVADSTLSQKSQALVQSLAKQKDSAILITDQKLEDLVFKTNCKVVAILDKNMSDNIITNALSGGGKPID